ncbi:MAG: trypsin-like peptidase domain-containing protein [Phycisphaerae bacterium]|nr:trypsin-like peptidase domain-containing protein [Phycisphaerae bacterium]
MWLKSRGTDLIRITVSVLCGLAVTTAPAQPSAREARRTPVVQVFEDTRDAVVNIACTQIVEMPTAGRDLFEHFFDFRSPLAPRFERRAVTSVGSGCVLHEDGYVVTNAHVVLKTVDQRIIFADKKEYKATPVAIDSKSDLAVLKVDADHPLPALKLGRSSDLMIGEPVVAIGNSLGYQHTLTTGVVSALDRTLRFKQGVEYSGLIQTDASINPGNSGGPLLNILGELIGINTAIRGDAENIGFAIPVDTLRQALPEMLSLERLKRVQVGMRVSGYETVRVVEVREGGPAALAGIEAGDRLVSLDGEAVKHDLDFYVRMLSRRADDRVGVQIERQGQPLATTLMLREIPVPDGAKLAFDLFGLRIAPLSAEIARELDLQGGLVVTEVEPDSPAQRAGLERGMLIVTIAGDFPRDLDHVGLLLERTRPGEAVVFRIWRLTRRVILVDEVVVRAR